MRALIAWLWRWLRAFCTRKQRKPYRRKRLDRPHHHYPRKPAWVIDEVIRIHLETDLRSRKVAATFNGIYKARCGVSVGKSFVDEQLRAYRYRANRLSEQHKHRKPPALPRNRVWALDMTGKEDVRGNVHSLFGVLDHGSRMLLTLQPLPERSAVTVLRALIAVIHVCGKPCIIKTDNEACFTSWLFRFVLTSLGIKHQRSKPGHPWQNGRIERLFGTLKEKLDRLVVHDVLGMRRALGEFRFWYNCVRPHQHLDGWTPWEAWHGLNPYQRAPKSVELFTAWDGLLKGYHMRR